MILHESRPWGDAVTVQPRLFSAVLLIALPCAVAACGRVAGQFEIVQNQVPQAGCLIDTSTSVYRGAGTLDLSLVQSGSRSAYQVYPLLRNNLPGSGSGPDPNRIEVNSFAVDIGPSSYGSMPDGVRDLFNALEGAGASSSDYALLHFSAPWAASVDSGGGVAASGVAAFPLELAARVRATGAVGVARSSMVANIRVRAFGSTTTQNVESDPFDFPVYVCDGCLVANVLTCPFSSNPSNPGNPCNVSQDDYVDCCSSNGSLICPPVVESSK